MTSIRVSMERIKIMGQHKNKVAKLPLLETLNNAELFNVNDYMQIPDYIIDNLKHNLRSYQKAALQNLDRTLRMDNADQLYNQLMFNMATGSGKTDIMAAVILYMYKRWGYQCFLFTVNSNAIINKTYDNLINKYSIKYLFKDPIIIDGNIITIKAVNGSFPSILEENTIYLSLTSIQSLSNAIHAPGENQVTKESLAMHKLVILADEAHHFNVGTKSPKENANSKDWETVLDIIRNSHPHNRQLEFTATIELSKKEIYEKYKNKIIYKYDLSNFINQGYSKNVYKLQANNDDETKMLNAVLLSQYRKRVAQSLDIMDFKPVILFKSNTIVVSNATDAKFNDMINNLNVEALEQFITTQNKYTKSEALSLAYKYWLKQDMGTTVQELKRDFSNKTQFNANDSSTTGIVDIGNNSERLNTLEDPDNPIRVIFAVAKLSEGWDVLNLYDVVRISEKNTSLKETNAEAQLIGRGARYYPFLYQGKRSYKRRFDNSKLKYQLLERLYYHTINDPKYLDNLRKSLDIIDLPVNDDEKITQVHAKVKGSFRKTSAYNYGNIFYNKIEKIPQNYFDSITKFGINLDTLKPINADNTTEENAIDSGAQHYEDTVTTTVMNVASFSNPADYPLIRTGLQRNKFFRFAELRKYCSNITSIKDFLTNDNWLGKAIIQARVSINSTMTPQRKLKIVDQYLKQIEITIKKNFKSYKGTNKFVPIPIKQIVEDYSRRIPAKLNSWSEMIRTKDMEGLDWYVYDLAIVDGLESRFIDQIASRIPDILKKYRRAYLIRIDEQNSNFSLHDFGNDITNYSGYMPDFIMYLEGTNYIYQIYMEPKGPQLLEQDSWKEKLLEKISPQNIEILGEFDNVKLYGVKFYTENHVENDAHHMFKELKEKNIF